MSIQVKSIDVYGIHDRLRKDKSKEGKEVWNYVNQLNEALKRQQALTGEAIGKLTRVSKEAYELRQALDSLVRLKDYKDKIGKDDHYEKQQPLAWAEAKKMLGWKD
jgi:hypothetical protein